MTIKVYDLAKMTTPTTGTTSPLVLGSAVSGFLSFSAAGVQDGETIRYAIRDGANSEIGYGVYSASGTTLTRNVTSSTNSNNAISLSGAAQVFITPSAIDLNQGPAFSAYQSSAQSSLPLAWTKIQFQTEEFDTDGCFDSATNYRFTPNVAGYYHLTGNLQLNGSSTLLIVGLYKNGVQIKTGPYVYLSVNGVAGGVSSVAYLNGSTDYAELWAFSETSRAPQAGSVYTYFTGFLVRKA